MSASVTLHLGYLTVRPCYFHSGSMPNMGISFGAVSNWEYIVLASRFFYIMDHVDTLDGLDLLFDVINSTFGIEKCYTSN